MVKNDCLNPHSFHGDNFVLQLLGLKQYGCELKLLETPVYRDLENNIIYFRDMLPLSSTRWDIYMNAVRYGDVIQEDLKWIKSYHQYFWLGPDSGGICKYVILLFSKEESTKKRAVCCCNYSVNYTDIKVYYTILDPINNSAQLKCQKLINEKTSMILESFRPRRA